MLNEHTLDQLRSLRLDGMVRAIEEQATSTAAATLSFDERLTLLVQREIAWRDDRRVQRLLKAAKLKVSSACVEDINWRASRALDRGLVTTLAGGDWLRHARNLLITGATGSGKTWLACALALFDQLRIDGLGSPRTCNDLRYTLRHFPDTMTVNAMARTRWMQAWLRPE